jgi:hypothetical protein
VVIKTNLTDGDNPGIRREPLDFMKRRGIALTRLVRMKSNCRPDIRVLLRNFNRLPSIATVSAGDDDPIHTRSPRARKKITHAISHHGQMTVTIREHFRVSNRVESMNLES